MIGSSFDLLMASSNFRCKNSPLDFSFSALFWNRASRRAFSFSSNWLAWLRSRASARWVGGLCPVTRPSAASILKRAPQQGHWTSISPDSTRRATMAECYAANLQLSNWAGPVSKLIDCSSKAWVPPMGESWGFCHDTRMVQEPAKTRESVDLDVAGNRAHI
jgi:hypothetical protein